MVDISRRFSLERPTLSKLWDWLSGVPGGSTFFSKLIGRMAPYTGTINCRIEELSEGHAVVALPDRKAVRNHLNSIHAIALMNLGEVATGLAVMYGIDGRGRGIIRSLNMDYLKKARGRITATCDVTLPTAPGDHDVNVNGELRDESGVVVSRVRAVWKISVDGPQS